MKHAQIVTTSPDVSPVMTGTLLIKPVLHSAAVPISILVQEAIKPAAVVLLVVESIKAANVIVAIAGMVLVALITV